MIPILTALAQVLYDKKATNIIVLDVRGICSLTDYFVIAEGSVARHVNALARVADELLEENGLRLQHREGKSTDEWVALDYGSVVVHLLTPELRQYYAIERAWGKGRLVQTPIRLQ